MKIYKLRLYHTTYLVSFLSVLPRRPAYLCRKMLSLAGGDAVVLLTPSLTADAFVYCYEGQAQEPRLPEALGAAAMYFFIGAALPFSEAKLETKQGTYRVKFKDKVGTVVQVIYGKYKQNLTKVHINMRNSEKTAWLVPGRHNVLLLPSDHPENADLCALAAAGHIGAAERIHLLCLASEPSGMQLHLRGYRLGRGELPLSVEVAGAALCHACQSGVCRFDRFYTLRYAEDAVVASLDRGGMLTVRMEGVLLCCMNMEI